MTLPIEVRRRLDIATPGEIAFVIDPDGVVSLRRLSPTWADVKGSVPALPGETADLEEEIADAVAAQLERKR